MKSADTDFNGEIVFAVRTHGVDIEVFKTIGGFGIRYQLDERAGSTWETHDQIFKTADLAIKDVAHQVMQNAEMDFYEGYCE